MMTVKKREHRLDATVVSSGGCCDQSQQNSDGVVVSVTVDDSFCAVATLLRGQARPGQVSAAVSVAVTSRKATLESP